MGCRHPARSWRRCEPHRHGPRKASQGARSGSAGARRPKRQRPCRDRATALPPSCPALATMETTLPRSVQVHTGSGDRGPWAPAGQPGSDHAGTAQRRCRHPARSWRRCEPHRPRQASWKAKPGQSLGRVIEGRWPRETLLVAPTNLALLMSGRRWLPPAPQARAEATPCQALDRGGIGIGRHDLLFDVGGEDDGRTALDGNHLRFGIGDPARAGGTAGVRMAAWAVKMFSGRNHRLTSAACKLT